MPRKLKGSAIQSGTISTVQLSSGVSSVISQGGGPKISNIGILNSVLVLTDDTAVDTNGGNIKITGSGFVSGCLVYINLVPAMTVSFLSSTEIQASVPATVAGTYPVYVVNPDGGTAICVPGLTFSASPNWQTSSGLGEYPDSVSITLTLSANLATSYTTVSGSLPPGLSLNGNTGVITGSVTGITVDTTYTFTVRATDAELQDSPRTFTVTITVGDPYFRLTTLLLTGNSGNTVVTDSSVNNFPITVVGDSRASNFSPYLTGWSCYFDGTGDYLTTTSNAALAFGTSDFTIEFWIYINAHTNTDGRPLGNNAGWTTNAWSIHCDHASYNEKFSFWVYNFNSSAVMLISTTSSTVNSWIHVAVTRSTNTWRMFINGTQEASQTSASSIDGGSTDDLFIAGSGAANEFVNGYISNLRIVKGTALYTANFTPATTTLTAVANTSLLTCHANRFVDSSTNNFAITRNGDVSVVSFNPFNSTNTGTTGSMYFDGTGDYLSVADNAAFSFGSSDFTIEMWVKTTQSGYIAGISKWQTGQLSWLIRTDDTSTGKWEFFYSTTGSNYVQTSGVNIKDGAWHHLAVSRSGANIRLFTDGVLSNTNTANPTIYTSTAPVVVGSDQGAQFFNGYISDVRVVKGTAVYTSNFTPPTAPVTNIANTQLLTLQRRQPHNNHSFQDSSANNFLITRSGNATQGAFSPFSQSGWSVYFNGSSSFTIHSGSDNPSIHSWLLESTASGSRVGTVEAWINLQSHSTPTVGSGEYTHRCIWGRGATFMNFGVRSDGRLRFYWYNSGTNQNWYQSASGVIKLNTWHHVAAVFTGGNGYLYVDGVLVSGNRIDDGTDTGSIAFNGIATGTFSDGGIHYLGQENGEPAQSRWLGYISNFHIVNGTAKYTSNFTPASSPLSVISDTKFLFANRNRFIDLSTVPYSPTVNSTPSVQAFSPFVPTAVYSAVTHGGSAYFDGSADYLTVPDNAVLRLGTEAFTIEAWVYLTATTTYQEIIGPHNSDAGWVFRVDNSTGLKAKFYTGTVELLGTITIPQNSWAHIAVVREGTGSNQFKIYVNGVLDVTSTNSNNYTQTNTYYIGAQQNALSTTYLNGYISSLRIVKGTALYTANFTPPTTPLTAVPNTTLLLNFTNDAIEDATGRNVIETVADARTTSAVTKWAGSHSIYFDGTGDYLFSPNTPLVPFGTGDFTIEVWIYPTKISTTNGIAIVSNRTDSTANTTLGCLWSNSNGIYLHTYSTVILNSGVQPTINVWQHVAYVRSSGTLKIYLNGSQIGSSTSFTADVSSQIGWYVGKDGTHSVSGAETFQGYMQDLRITRGYARYTSNFTPPTSQFRLK